VLLARWPSSSQRIANSWVSQESKLETGLGGWGARIRTWEWRNQNPDGSPDLSERIPKNCGNSASNRINRLGVISQRKTCAIEGSLSVQFEPTCVGSVAWPYRDYAIRRLRYHSLGAGSAKSGRPISGCGLMRAQFRAVERRHHSIVPRLVQSQTACRKRSTSGQYRDLGYPWFMP
jgi:hypothetical protein